MMSTLAQSSGVSFCLSHVFNFSNSLVLVPSCTVENVLLSFKIVFNTCLLTCLEWGLQFRMKGFLLHTALPIVWCTKMSYWLNIWGFATGKKTPKFISEKLSMKINRLPYSERLWNSRSVLWFCYWLKTDIEMKIIHMTMWKKNN